MCHVHRARTPLMGDPNTGRLAQEDLGRRMPMAQRNPLLATTWSAVAVAMTAAPKRCAAFPGASFLGGRIRGLLPGVWETSKHIRPLGGRLLRSLGAPSLKAFASWLCDTSKKKNIRHPGGLVEVRAALRIMGCTSAAEHSWQLLACHGFQPVLAVVTAFSQFFLSTPGISPASEW